ncbi:MAG TPA: aconitate hydratase [Syntrophales bacterium]|nr:aconitate hydratase [Syntrophales bacterium]
MGKTLTQKLIEDHLVSGRIEPGGEIGIRIDQTLTQDATGTMAYLQFEALGIDRVRTELSMSYIDHNTIQIGFESADDHRYLQTVARRYGIRLSRAGNGISHQVHLERFAKPGKTLLGSDSHTSTCGAMGMLAIGAGGLDVALAMAGEPFFLTCPRVVRVNLTGKLLPWVSAKDVILKLLEIFTTKGNVGHIFEYGGDGLGGLAVPERATIANMGAELGLTTSVFPSDSMTRLFLAAEQREADWAELAADPDADYAKVININLAELVPLAAKPHSPDNIGAVRELAGLPVDQVCIGSCTNSSYRELATVARILRGRVAHPRVSFIVTPGSRQVLENISREGYLADLLCSGARLTESSCGFCIGGSHSPGSQGVSLRTSNRNFHGRSGTEDAQVYLVSPETAAAAVLTGVFTDPRDLGMDYPSVPFPETFHVDDCMILEPAPQEKAAALEILRGPNIGDPPQNAPLPEPLHGEVTIKVGDKITTDHIMPAGIRMKYRSNIRKYADFVFEGLDPTFSARASKIRDNGNHNFIVAGLSYGQGSSREHAALCPMYLGVKAVIAKSFERIHTANLINFGILPLHFENESEYNLLDQGDSLEIPNVRQALLLNKPLTVSNLTKGRSFSVLYALSERQRKILLAGGALNLVKRKGDR